MHASQSGTITPAKPFEYQPIEQLCPYCGSKHFELGPVCARCQRAP